MDIETVREMTAGSRAARNAAEAAFVAAHDAAWHRGIAYMNDVCVVGTACPVVEAARAAFKAASAFHGRKFRAMQRVVYYRPSMVFFAPVGVR